MALVGETERVPRIARYLGYGGVIPFVAMVINVVAEGPLPAAFAFKAFVYYSAVILSFLGGIRWGAATNLDAGMSRELVLSIAPGLWAVLCLLLGDPGFSVSLLLVGFVLAGLVDVYRPAPGLAPWMRQLRKRLTILVVICHLAVAASLGL